MARGVRGKLLSSLNVSDGLLCIVVLLFGCMAFFFLSPHCKLHLSFGAHNNHSILIDAFILQLALSSKAILSPLYAHPRHLAVSKILASCISEVLLKTGCASNLKFGPQEFYKTLVIASEGDGVK